MTDARDGPALDDVMETTEQAKPDRREHAKASPHLDDDALEVRVEEEREAVALDSAVSDDSPPG
jgi:hypothetical protein